jgi:hypothetical protein
MKTTNKYLLISILLFTCFNKTGAQTNQPKLNQVALMRQFLGTWTCELGKDTFLVSENKPFGRGMTANGRITTQGRTLDSIVQIYGYNKSADRYVLAELIRSSSAFEICTTWFTSATAGELTVENTENSKFKWRFEFKTPDSIVQTAMLDGEVIKEISLTRVKNKK